MTRIRKSPEERRQEIVECAGRLFLVQGYDNTAVSDICREVGIAKGTFFYYFATKEEVFEHIMQVAAGRFAAELGSRCRGKNALESMQLFFASLGQDFEVDSMLDKIGKGSEYKYFD